MAGKKRELIDQRFIQSLAHPLRVAALERLSEEVASPNLLAEKMGIGLSSISYHVRVLNKCGTLELVREEQKRGATEHFYRAKPEAFIGGREWRKVPQSLRSGGVSAAVIQDFSDKATAALEAGTIDARDETALSCISIAVDDSGWKELERLREKVVGLFLGVHQRSVERLGDDDGASVIVGLATFEAAGSHRPKPKERS